MHFSHAVAAIQSLVGVIKRVHILYSEKEALNVDLVINLTKDGIKLIFDPVNQRLRTVEVYDLSLLRLKYRYARSSNFEHVHITTLPSFSDVLFNCADVAPTIEQIDQSFGATHPGVFDDERRVFTLTFRGLSFEFPAETPFQVSLLSSHLLMRLSQFFLTTDVFLPFLAAQLRRYQKTTWPPSVPAGRVPSGLPHVHLLRKQHQLHRASHAAAPISMHPCGRHTGVAAAAAHTGTEGTTSFSAKLTLVSRRVSVGRRKFVYVVTGPPGRDVWRFAAGRGQRYWRSSQDLLQI